MSWTQPTLTGHGVLLEPLTEIHRAELRTIVEDPVIWEFQPQAKGPYEPSWLDRWLDATLSAADEMPFAVRRSDDGKLVGTTRYLAITPRHRRLEVGGTFYAANARATFVNPACKRLLLAHAFEVFGCQRVELKCDVRNVRSSAAIAAIGAVREGVLRQHMVLGDGHKRDTVYFSVLDREWPTVRERLDARLTTQ